MFFTTPSLGLVAASLLSLGPAVVQAHGAVTSYIIDGTEYAGYDGFNPSFSGETIQWGWPNYDPIMQASSPNMLCNGGRPASISATIEAGSNITAVWKQWTHEQGPIMVWMYPCDGDFSSCDGKGQKWFKIDQMGFFGTQLNSADWGTAIVYDKHEWSSKIPAGLKPGNYLIRHELLALHQANTPQFYPECANLVVTGSGSGLPETSCMKSIPGYAAQSDPGVTVDIYSATTQEYTCPGGPVCDV